MKKVLSVLFILCVLVSITACDLSTAQPKKETADNNTADVVSKKVEDEKFSLNETAIFDNIKVTATKIEESNGKNFFEPESGKVFVGVNFEIENISDESQNISSLLLFDAYVDDVKCEYSVSANVAFGDGTLDGEISPGKKLVGWYSVEAPQDWKQLELEVKSDWLSNNKAVFVFDKQ